MKLSTLAFVTLVTLASAEDAPRVHTKSGTIKGYYKISTYGRRYRAFEGIPYAKPPVGDLRFEPPQPADAWKGELSATGFSSVCMQHNYVPLHPEITGSEDCLYLNVYTPILTSNATLLPVIFYIYGGAFRTGSGGRFGSTYLLNRDIILISLNFRLGPLGWLSTEDDVVPGNMAMKDQSTALRWISENIEAFGGNSSRILLAGHSSGGVNVHHHYLSPWSAGLFEKGMSMSGTALFPQGIFRGSLERAKQVAAFLNCTTVNNTAMVRCLKFVNATDILGTMPKFFDPSGLAPIAFGAVVEKGGDSPFLNATPYEIISSGRVQDVPWITGVVSEEGAQSMCALVLNETFMGKINENWEIVAPLLLGFDWTIPAANQSEMASLIRGHYFGSAPIDNSSVGTLIDVVSAGLFQVSAEEAARLQAMANESPVWFYYNSYRGAYSFTNTITGTNINFGVSHADDISYILENPIGNMTTTAQDRAMQNDLIDFWISYAYNDAPSVGIDWPPMDPYEDELRYVHFWGPSNASLDVVTNFAQKQFWKSIILEG